MRKILMLSLAMFAISGVVCAQHMETTFIIQNTKNGEEVVDVRYQAIDYDFQVDSFTEADANGDGCVDRTEARDKGILDFDRFALTNKSCLNEEEYMRAMQN